MLTWRRSTYARLAAALALLGLCAAELAGLISWDSPWTWVAYTLLFLSIIIIPTRRSNGAD